MAVIFTLKRHRPGWPGILLAVVLAAIVTAAANFDIATVGSRFGAMPAGLPMPHVPAISMAKVMDVLPAAISFTLLGAIESLLSAVVADGMTGRRHRSNCELVAQGAGNLISGLIGGLPMTAVIVRGSTNIQSGARTRMSAFVHGVLLRQWVMGLLNAIPFIGNIIALVDPLMIFGDERRCLHDHIAGTKVIVA